MFFQNIHRGTTSIDKDKYLTPSQSTRVYQVFTQLIAGPRLIGGSGWGIMISE